MAEDQGQTSRIDRAAQAREVDALVADGLVKINKACERVGIPRQTYYWIKDRDARQAKSTQESAA